MSKKSSTLVTDSKLRSELRRLSKLQVEGLKMVDLKAGRLQANPYYRNLAKKQERHLTTLPRSVQVLLIDEMHSLEQSSPLASKSKS